MIAPWELDDFLQLLDEEQQEALSDFLEVDSSVINQQQRIMGFFAYPPDYVVHYILGEM